MINKPCPICCSYDLTENTWQDVLALECNECKNGAPKEAWNSDRCEKRLEMQRLIDLKVVA